MVDILINDASQDRSTVDPFAQRLVALGWSVW
jgi:hypothetical protein